MQQYYNIVSLLSDFLFPLKLNVFFMNKNIKEKKTIIIPEIINV